MMIKRFIKTRPPKFYYMNKVMKMRPFVLLDIGSGNFSPSKTIALFPGCTYHGLDLNKSYSYSEADEKAMKRFFEKDLTRLEYSDIPDDHYDYINMAHVIEHLHNGDQVLEKLAPKLRTGGHIYIEYPGQRSTKLPSMHGTLNFYDDPTHVRIYNTKEIEDILKKNGFEIISAGQRRSWTFILLTPFNVVKSFIKDKKIQASVFWDLLGFAEYVFARKVR